jgi:hypothetical protein
MRDFFIIIPFVLFIHEMEEWNIVKYHQENYENKIDENNLGTRLWLFLLSLTGLFFGLISLSLKNTLMASTFFLILSTFLTINGIQHIIMSLITKKYNPGLIFGGILGTTLSILFDIKIVGEEIIPLWLFLTVTLMEFIPAIFDTVQSRKTNRMPKLIIQICRISNFLERKIVA